MITKEKQRAQVKSKWYYIFWGAATISVFAGQIFVEMVSVEWQNHLIEL